MRRRATILTIGFLIWFVKLHAQPPTANFTASATEACTPVVINFQDQSTGNPTSWFWDFGNGATSTLQNPSTTYFKAGTYTVTLTATNGAGDNTLTRTQYITIYAKPTVRFSVSDSLGCFPLRAHFKDQSTPSAGTTNASWVWDFGNGIQDSTENPTMIYDSAGNYSVTLKVTNDKGCYSVLSKDSYINVGEGVRAAFTNAPPGICKPPYPIAFHSASQGPGTLTYSWDFGDGGTGSDPDIIHTYNANGNYSVTLAVTSSEGCSDTITKPNLLQIQDIKTDFTLPPTVCQGTPALFANNSSPRPLGSVWNFGDGTFSKDTSALKAFSTANTFPVKLVNDYGYCIDSTVKDVTVTPKPTAAFTTSTPYRCQPSLDVSFTDQSTNAVSWYWDFGDSTNDTKQNPTHTYTKYGYFRVRLIVSNAAGCTDTLTKDSLVRIVRPVLNIKGVPTKGCLPFPASFTDSVKTLDVVNSYTWDFGDSSAREVKTTSGTVPHLYTKQGSFDVMLITQTSTGCTDTLNVTKAVKAGYKPTPGFDALPNPACARKPVQFLDTSSAPPDNKSIDDWQWDFGDGKTVQGIQNPTHAYADSGTYTIKFTVSNSGCSDSMTKTDYLTVKPPVANFTFTMHCDNRLRFYFSDSSTLSKTLPASYRWDFGDNTTDSVPNPVHTFPAYRPYKVTLMVTIGDCTDTVFKTVRVVNENPTFKAMDTVLCRTGVVDFVLSNYDPSNIISYNWDFGNGSHSVPTNGSGYNGETHLYPLSGTYNVSLVTTDIYNCTNTFGRTNYILIKGPTAKFSATDTAGCKGLTTTFHDLSTTDGHAGIISWQWNFGDNNSQGYTHGPFQHTFNTPGDFDVKLVITDASGCMDSVTVPRQVHATDPRAAIAVDSLWCPDHEIQFHNASASVPFTSAWSFGDGQVSDVKDPVHTYTSMGSYTISLKITDIYGCQSSVTLPDYIKVKQPVASFSINDTATSCPPLEAHFTNTSQFYASSLWNLGGGISTVPNPIHYYNNVGVYTIMLVVTSPGGCRDTASARVQVFDTAGTRITYNPFGGCKPLDVSLSAFSPGPMHYTWDFGDGVLIDTSATQMPHTYDFFGKFVPKVIMTDPTGCIFPITGADTIRIIGATAKFGLDRRLLCDSGIVAFTDSTTFNDTPVKYNWHFGDGTISNDTVPTHFYGAPGQYTVSLDVHTLANCADTFSITQAVKVVQSPVIGILGDSVICANDFLQHVGVFKRQDTSAVQWTWQFPNGNSANSQVPVLQQYTEPGNYDITALAVNSSGCRDSASESLRVNPLPVINAPSTISIQSGFPVTIPANYSSNIATYLWTPATGLSCANCPQPIAAPKFNTKYIVAVTDSNHCRSTAEVQVITFCKNANVFVPNTFSPNGDGMNDIFYVRGRGLERVKTLRIFNRWGQMVFERSNFPVNDPATGWDGRFNGNKPAPGVYVYQVDVFCENGDTIHFEGNVALIL